MGAYKRLKSCKKARTASNQFTSRQQKLKEERLAKNQAKKEKGHQNKQSAELQKHADFLNNPPSAIEIIPEPNIVSETGARHPFPEPSILLSMPDVDFMNKPNFKSNVVRAFVSIKRNIHQESDDRQKPDGDPTIRQKTRPKKLGVSKLIIPIEAAPAETTETLAPGLLSVQEEVMELADIEVEKSNAAVPNVLIKRKPRYDFFPDDSDLGSSSDESDMAALDPYVLL